MTIERRPITDRELWKEWWREHVTASVVRALKCDHPYCTPLKLYVEKRGVEFPSIDSKVMRRGRWLEPSVAKAVSELRPDWRVLPADVYICDTELRLGATPDFYIAGDPRGVGILQAKTITLDGFTRDWDNGREVPPWIVWQTLTEAMLEDAAFAAVAALTIDPFNMECTIIELERDAAIEQEIRDLVERFWQDVASGKEPDPDYAKDTDAIRALTAQSTPGKVLDAAGLNELPDLLSKRGVLMAIAKDAESQCEEINNQVRDLMGDCEVMTGLPDWRVTYKTVNRKGYVVEPKSSRQLRILDRRPEHEKPTGDEII